MMPQFVAQYLSHAIAIWPPLVGIGIAFALFRKILPNNSTAATSKTLEQLTAEYGKWEKATGLIMLVLVVPLVALFWFLLTTCAQWYDANLLPAAEVSLVPFPIYWGLPAIFLGILASGPILFRITRHVLKDRYSEFLAYQSMKYGFDSAKANKVTMIVTAAICFFLVALGLHSYVQVRDNNLVVSGYFASESEHDLATVSKIQTAPQLIAPNGNTVKRREYVINFKDGYTWTTSDLLARLSDQQKRGLMELLAKKAGVLIEEIPVFAKGAL